MDDNLLSGAFAGNGRSYTARVLRTDFKPWHKPRKMYIRDQQWRLEVEQLADDLDLARRQKPLSYLTLPGDDFIDIRALRGSLHPRGIALKFVGINDFPKSSQREADTTVAFSSLTQMPGIDGSSLLLNHKLEDVAREDSLLPHRIAEDEPLHAINLDLCDSVFKASGPEDRPFHVYLNAVQILLRKQFSVARTPWLLFITTHCSVPELQGVHQDLLGAIASNVNADNSFASRTATLLRIAEDELRAAAVDITLLGPDVLCSLAALGLAKWLLAMSFNAEGAKWLVELRDSYKYGTTLGVPDLLSLAFRFEPARVNLLDRIRLVPALQPKRNPTELELAHQAISKVEGIRDVDDLLASDAAMARRIISLSAGHMGAANYDVDAYTNRFVLD